MLSQYKYKYNAVAFAILCVNRMLNMLIILSRYKQFASKIYNAISMYIYFLCKLITDLHNSIHFITELNHMHKSSAKKIGGSVVNRNVS